MARRKISENRSEEVAYRLLELVRRHRAYSPNEIKFRYLSIRDMAKLWGVKLDDELFLELIGKVRVMVDNPPEAPPVGGAEAPKVPAPIVEEKDLTPKPKGSILDELGWGDKDGNQKD